MTECEKEERACELCTDAFFDGTVNTNQWNVCEGSRCDDSMELVDEEIEDELMWKIEERNKKLDKLLNQ